jgi:hypothetical protein
MTGKTWKNNEVKISKIFGTKRNPFSGSMSHQSMSDTLHEKFYIEMKDGKQSLPTKLWTDTVRKAKEEKKIPMLIQHGKGEKMTDSRITLSLSDFIALAKVTGTKGQFMNPPQDSVPEIKSKLASNKNRKVKNGIHTEKTKGKKKEEAVEKVK